MRILLPTLHYYPDFAGGSTRLAYDEALYLARLGHETWIVTQDLSHTRPGYAVENGVHILRYPSPRLFPFDPRRTRIHQRLTQEILARNVGGGVDLIHGHALLQYAGALEHFPRARSCYSVHSPVRLELDAAAHKEPALRKPLLLAAALISHRIERTSLERSQHVTAFSEYTQRMLGELHGAWARDKTVVCPGWVDLHRFQIIQDREETKRALGWPTDRPVLFTLRRLVPRMGLDRLLQAAQAIKAAGVEFQLVIGGTGPLRGTLERMVRELGLNDTVCLVGYVPELTLAQMYGAADAFVLPTTELECFGLIAIEALACGRPVLATPVGAIPEILKEIEPRWLARDVSVQAITELAMDYLRGVLPAHAPQELRANAARRFERKRVLAQLVQAAGVPANAV